MSVHASNSAGARNLFVVGCIVFAEPLASTLLIPFVYFMVRDFANDSALTVGTQVGLITSSFFLCQMITTPLWGLFSDRFGRKRTFLIGLLGGALSMVCFGLSGSLVSAILSRSICGLLNGNIGVARTAIGEIAYKYRIPQMKAFSALGLAGALGYIAGPLIGGMLSRPAQNLRWSGPGNVFVEYPYLLPCLVCTAFNLAIWALVVFGLEETNTPKKVDIERPTIVVTEETSLLTRVISTEVEPKRIARAPWRLSRDVVVLLVATSLICLHTIMFEEVYALFAASSLEKGTGLDFQSRDIAISLSVLGPVVFTVQLFIYPMLNSRIDTVKLWKISALSFAIDYPLVSFLPEIRHNSLRWICLILTLCNRVASHVVGWTSLNIITNHVVNPDQRGFITGIVQASASFSRGIGPAIGGTLWSWSESNGFNPPFDFHLFFLTISLIAVLQGVTGYWIPAKAASKD